MRWLGILLCCVLLASCASNLTVNLESSRYLNPDANKQSLPVLVKVYQLTDDQIFKQASFDGLWLQPKQVLGRTFLSTQSITIVPKATKSVSIKAAKGVNYVGFVAVFRTRDRSNWRVIKSVSWMSHRYDLRLRGNVLEVSR